MVKSYVSFFYVMVTLADLNGRKRKKQVQKTEEKDYE